MTADIAKRASVIELVRTYQQAQADIKTAFALVHSATGRLNESFSLGNGRVFYIRDSSHHCVNFEDPSRTLDALKRDAWRAFVERLGIRAMLSVARAKQLDEQLERGVLPEITEASVFAFAKGYADQLDTMLTEAVQEVFGFLRPRGSNLKTNTEYAIGPKVILHYMVDPDFSSHFHANYHYEAELTALENVFGALDGKGQIHKGHRSDLQNAIGQTPLNGDGRGETDYFKFRCFRNRNLHLVFKRMDLVERLNKIAGANRLAKGATP